MAPEKQVINSNPKHCVGLSVEGHTSCGSGFGAVCFLGSMLLRIPVFQGCVEAAMKLKMVYPFLGRPKELEYRDALLKKGFTCWRATVLSKTCALDLKPSSFRAWDIGNVLTEAFPSPKF